MVNGNWGEEEYRDQNNQKNLIKKSIPTYMIGKRNANKDDMMQIDYRRTFQDEECTTMKS